MPADILTSGIVVEISGVRVRLKVEPETDQEHGSPRPEQRKPLAKGTKSNRSRMATPTIHDPGGYRSAQYGLLEDPLFHPDVAAHHLAESFLQTESREDRLELQAAIASQPRYGQSSLSSSTISDEEVGLGTAEGYTLPSFIASYLVGIADRLQLRVKDVAVHLEFVHSREGVGFQQIDATRSTNFLLRISELCVEGVNSLQEGYARSAAKRKVVLHQFDMLVLPDPPNDSPNPESPEATSPLLKHSLPSPSSSSLASNLVQSLGPGLMHSRRSDQFAESAIDLNCTQGIEQSVPLGSVTNQPAAAPQSAETDRSIDDYAAFAATLREHGTSGNSDGGSHSSVEAFSLESENDVFHDASNATDEASSLSRIQEPNSRRSSSAVGLDSQVHAENVATSGQIGSGSSNGIQVGQSVEDLTESKIFTHEEAESMYMSAMAADKSSARPINPMPGAWDSLEERSDASGRYAHSDVARSPIGLALQNEPASLADATTPSASRSPLISKETPGKNGPCHSHDSLAQMSHTVRQLIFINRISAWLPTTQESDLPKTPTLEPARVQSVPRDAGTESHSSRDASASGNLHDFGIDANEAQRRVAQPSSSNDAEAVALATHSVGATKVEVLNVRFQFDMQIGNTLVAIAKSIVGKSVEATKGDTDPVPTVPLPEMFVKVNNIEIAFLEHVPEISILPTAATKSSYDDALLLSISFAGLAYNTSFSNGAFQQQLHLTKMFLSQSRGQFLSFSHDSRMRT